MKGRQISYSPEELAWIKACSDLPRADLYRLFIEIFKRTDVAQTNLTALCKRKGWLTGRTGRFVKGQVTDNGMKGKPAHPNTKATQFKKGGVSHTYRGPGHERVCNKDGYVTLIVAETNPWTGAKTRPVLKHRYLWEQANGPVPKGMRLKCLDGDRANTDPANWEAVPFGLALRLNGKSGRGYDTAPDELRPVIMATAKLEHHAHELRKRKGPRHG
jgi:hypothetical protein